MLREILKKWKFDTPTLHSTFLAANYCYVCGETYSIHNYVSNEAIIASREYVLTFEFSQKYVPNVENRAPEIK